MHLNSKLLATAATLAHALAEAVPIGGPVLAAAQAGLGLLNDLRQTADATPEAVAEFEAGRDALEAAVLAHADKTAASLGD